MVVVFVARQVVFQLVKILWYFVIIQTGYTIHAPALYGDSEHTVKRTGRQASSPYLQALLAA